MKGLFSFSYLLVIILFCGLLHFPFLGEINLFDWDETMVASISKEMFMQSEVLHPLLDGKFYLEKPPLFYWFQMISYRYIGVNEYAARFPNAVCAILICFTLYQNGRRLYSRYFGMSWVVVYLSIFITQIYHKSALLEPWFSFFVYLCLYNLSRIIEMRQERYENLYRKKEISSHIRFSALALVGAFMTNGIEAIFVVVFSYLMIFLLSSARYGIGYKNFIKIIFYAAFFLSIWVFIEYKWHGAEYLMQFWDYQWAELDLERASWGKKNAFPILVLLIGCFPASLFAFNSLKIKTYEYTLQKVIRLMMLSCLVVTLILTIFFKVKVAHYLFLGIIPISFLATYSLRYILEEKKKIHGFVIFLTALIGGIWAAVLIGIPMTGSKIAILNKYFEKDSLIYAFQNLYQWQEFEMYFGIAFAVLLLISIVLMLTNYSRAGTIILFFSTMVISETVIVYFMPKIEIITQGPHIEFVKQNINMSKKIHYLGGTSYADRFYRYVPIDSTFDKEYIIIKKRDSLLASDSVAYQYLYSQDLYSFYEKK